MAMADLHQLHLDLSLESNMLVQLLRSPHGIALRWKTFRPKCAIALEDSGADGGCSANGLKLGGGGGQGLPSLTSVDIGANCGVTVPFSSEQPVVRGGVDALELATGCTDLTHLDLSAFGR